MYERIAQAPVAGRTDNFNEGLARAYVPWWNTEGRVFPEVFELFQ